MSSSQTVPGSPNLLEKIFHAGPVKISFAEGPRSGPPLILLHGLGRSWQDFLLLIPALSQRWHIYAVDLRGHGKSGRVPRGYTSAAYAADIAGLLQHVVAEPAILFGHSLGGVTSMHLAAAHPELVRAAILGDNLLSRERLGPSMYVALFRGLHELILAGGSVQQTAARLAAMQIVVPGLDHPIALGDLPGNDEAYLLKWADCLSNVDPETLAMMLDGSTLADFDGPALLSQMRCPTLILQANPELGGLMPDVEIAMAMRLLAQPRLVKFPLLGHALHLQKPQPVLKVVTEFLESL